MSGHYIYIACPVEGCDKTGSVYTGGAFVDYFEKDQWEGERIIVPCDEHLDEAQQ